jgi:hypothetical protein
MDQQPAPLYAVIMSNTGRVAHLEDERTGLPLCGRRIETGRRLGLNACRICVETEKFIR